MTQVNLHQFQADHMAHVQIYTGSALWMLGQGNLKVAPLHKFGAESVALVHFPAGERFHGHTHFGGEEIFVLSGEFRDEHGHYTAGTWLRSPHMSQHTPFVEQDKVIWVKTGHLSG